ncbi:MAG: hypothetical protein WDO73_29305 [Ignavibacteriota bacterium]
MQNVSDNFMNTGGCVSCHAQNLGAASNSYAKVNGISIDQEAQNRSVEAVKALYGPTSDGLLARLEPPGSGYTTAFALYQLAISGAFADRTTDSLVHNLVDQQYSNGSWHVGPGGASTNGGRRFLPVLLLRSMPSGRMRGRPGRPICRRVSTPRAPGCCALDRWTMRAPRCRSWGWYGPVSPIRPGSRSA